MGIARKHLSEQDLIRIAGSLFTVTSHDGQAGELRGLCPVHQEKNPSFGYNYRKDACNCFSCGFDGDLCALWSAVNGYDKESGFTAFCREYHIVLGPGGSGHSDADRAACKNDGGLDDAKPPDDDIPGTLDDLWELFPPLPESWISRFEEERGWSRKWMEILDLRLQTRYRDKKSGELRPVKGDPQRVAIPVRDSDGTIRNIRLYRPGGGAGKIISWSKQYGSARLFPARPLLDGDPVLLCEGEPDTICALSQGFNGITQTSKLKIWKSDHLKPFTGRDVVIAYDADEAGQKYAVFAAQNLVTAARSVRLLEWPDFMKEDGGYPKDHGQDLTDFFVRHKKTAGDLQALMAAARVYDPGEDAGPLRFFERGVNDRFSFKPRLLADRIMRDYSLMSDPTTGRLYKWKSLSWEDFDENYIKNSCIYYLEKEAKRSMIEDVLYQVKALCTIPHGRAMNDRTDWVNIENGMLNLHTLEIRPHDPEFYFTHMLHVTFDPESPQKCPRWLQWCDETIQTPASIAQLQEFTGYCFLRTAKYEKCLFLLGPGSDGKSTYLKILREIIGPENCASVSFSDLEDQFHRSSLYGKLVNISTEIGAKAIETPYFKAITSGDPINAAFKHKDVFEYTPFVKLCFAGNRLPRVLDNSDGFFRKLLLIEHKRQFIEGEDADPDLLATLKGELSGIFAWAILGLHRLLSQNRFTESEETRNLLMEYRRTNNPVLCFVEDECELDRDYTEQKDALYVRYETYCRTNGYSRMNKGNFLRELFSAVASVRKYRARLRSGEREHRLSGIRLRVDLFPPAPPSPS